MDVLVYKAIYRMDDVYAEGYIILNDSYVEGIFANDYIGIYKENNMIFAELRAFTLDKLPNNNYKHSYTTYLFNMCGKELVPGNSHNFFSIVGCDNLCLDILEETVEGNYACYLVEGLLPILREISSI